MDPAGGEVGFAKSGSGTRAVVFFADGLVSSPSCDMRLTLEGVWLCFNVCAGFLAEGGMFGG